MTNINSPMELLTPAYNKHFHTLELENGTPVVALTEGKICYNLINNPTVNQFNLYYYKNYFADALQSITINNDLVNDTFLYEWSIQPVKANDLLFLQNYFTDSIFTTPITDTRVLLQPLLSCYNQWAYVFNSTATNNYLKFEVVFNRTAYEALGANVPFSAWEGFLYVKYTPLKGKYYNFAVNNGNILLNDGIGIVENPNKVLELQQPNHKIEVYTNDNLFPSLVNNATQKVLEFQTPIAKNLEDVYVSYVNMNSILKKYVKTKLPAIGDIVLQDKYLKPYWFRTTERGNIIKNNKATSSILSSDVTNYDRSLLQLELDTNDSDVKWVCNAAKDKLSLDNMKDYYRNEQTIVPLALTNQPELKESYFCDDNFNNSREFVSFIYIGGLIETIDIITTVTFNDGTTIVITKTVTLDLPLGDCYTVDISPDVIGLRELSNQNIFSWSVRLGGGTSAIIDVVEAEGFLLDFSKGLAPVSQFGYTNQSQQTISLVFKNGMTLYSGVGSIGGQDFVVWVFPSFVVVFDFPGSIGNYYSFASPLLPNTLYNVVVTRDNNIETVYLDNVVVGTYSNRRFPTSVQNFLLGSLTAGGVPGTRLEIFDFKAYTRVLNSTEIADIYNSMGDISPTGAFIDIPFSEYEGLTFADISGNGNNMLMTGFGGLPSDVQLGATNHHIDIDSNPILTGTTIIPGTSFDLVKPLSYKRLINGLPNRFNVLFINQLGMWDTFTFTGDNDFNYNQKYNRFRATQSINYTPNDLITGNYNSIVNKGYSLKSSQLDSKHIQWLQELLDSPEIKIYNNGKLESYYINKSDIKFDSIKSFYTVNLDLIRTIENNSINN